MPSKKLDIEVAESVHGTWHYHLREAGSHRALCGASVMFCSMPLKRWNVKIPDFHLPQSFCSECDHLRQENRDAV